MHTTQCILPNAVLHGAHPARRLQHLVAHIMLELIISYSLVAHRHKDAVYRTLARVKPDVMVVTFMLRRCMMQVAKIICVCRSQAAV